MTVLALRGKRPGFWPRKMGISSPALAGLAFQINLMKFAYRQGSQSTLIAPQVELPQSWMNFS
ncbi:MAG TPA: hypothetical protein PK918_01590, partial [Methanotrichaceae archaeon]|nr:hypothetical protein [Methanotrichaceae archaeon]